MVNVVTKLTMVSKVCRLQSYLDKIGRVLKCEVAVGIDRFECKLKWLDSFILKFANNMFNRNRFSARELFHACGQADGRICFNRRPAGLETCLKKVVSQ
jgi:hypothetical protein